MSKQELRKELASLGFSEKIKILEQLRDRSLAIAAAGLRNNRAEGNRNDDVGFCRCLGWEACGCGNQPPYHCMLCCKELSPEQVAASRTRGFYKEGAKE